LGAQGAEGQHHRSGQGRGHEFGYSLYGEIEDSDSYYRNVFTKNALFSAAFDTDITSNLRAEFGGTWQKYKGVQNSGWNRVTQDLINTGTYVTGQGTSLDTNGDGKISREEAAVANGGNGLAGMAASTAARARRRRRATTRPASGRQCQGHESGQCRHHQAEHEATR
jgi:hypothetical protein